MLGIVGMLPYHEESEGRPAALRHELPGAQLLHIHLLILTVPAEHPHQQYH